jgi:hypothetical protein
MRDKDKCAIPVAASGTSCFLISLGKLAMPLILNYVLKQGPSYLAQINL